MVVMASSPPITEIVSPVRWAISPCASLGVIERRTPMTTAAAA